MVRFVNIVPLKHWKPLAVSHCVTSQRPEGSATLLQNLNTHMWVICSQYCCIVAFPEWYLPGHQYYRVRQQFGLQVTILTKNATITIYSSLDVLLTKKLNRTHSHNLYRKSTWHIYSFIAMLSQIITHHKAWIFYSFY